MNAILTYARGWQTLAATRNLGEKGVRVITSDSVRNATSFYSRYSKDHFLYKSPIQEEEFIESFLKNLKKHAKKGDVIIPIFEETYMIAKHIEKFKDYKIPIATYKKFKLLNNKWELKKFAKSHGIRTPKTYIENIEKIKEYPCLIKIPESAGGIGIKIVNKKEELINEYENISKTYKVKPIVQEFIKGIDYCVTVLFNKGELKAKMTYKNIKQFPPKIGVGVLSKTVSEPEMEKMAEKICKEINWHGVAEFDFRKTKEGKAYLIECNPRFWVSLNQSIKSGINYPYLLYEIATKGDCKKELKPKIGVETEFYIGNAAAEAIEIMKAKNPIKKALQLTKHHLETEKDILSIKDPLPVLGALYPISLLVKKGKIDIDMLLHS